VASAKFGFVVCKWTFAAARALPRRFDVDLEVDDEHVELAQQAARLDRAAADRDNARFATVAHVLDEARLELAKRRLAFALEQFPNRPVRVLDFAVDVVERAFQTTRDLAAHGRLTRAHKPDQREMAS